MKIVILAGGSGTRLWPISRQSYPKQFLCFDEKYSLLQKTLIRFLKKFPPHDLLIVTQERYLYLVKEQASKINPLLKDQILMEPESKNTAPAIALTVKFLIERAHVSEDECFLVSSSDAFMHPDELFLQEIDQAEQLAKQGFHVLFGIRPTHPETGYGYIKCKTNTNDSKGILVEKFVEKPQKETALKYLQSGQFLWNAGIFVFHIAHILTDLQKHAPEIYEHFSNSFQEMYDEFHLLPNFSIDFALMEKTNKAKVIPLNITWSDIGSWDSIYDISEKNQNGNFTSGHVFDVGSKNSLIISEKRLVATMGLEDTIVVETGDAVFVTKKGHSQQVKALVEILKEKAPKYVEEHQTLHRPWGHFTVLETGERYKIKRIVVHPGQKLSLQLHYHRSEHWIIIKGTAKITLDDQEQLLHENESIFVPKSTMHRLENPGKVSLEIIEVQVGEYVGEDDIIRFEDIYGRKTEMLLSNNTN